MWGGGWKRRRAGRVFGQQHHGWGSETGNGFDSRQHRWLKARVWQCNGAQLHLGHKVHNQITPALNCTDSWACLDARVCSIGAPHTRTLPVATPCLVPGDRQTASSAAASTAAPAQHASCCSPCQAAQHRCPQRHLHPNMPPDRHSWSPNTFNHDPVGPRDSGRATGMHAPVEFLTPSLLYNSSSGSCRQLPSCMPDHRLLRIVWNTTVTTQARAAAGIQAFTPAGLLLCGIHISASGLHASCSVRRPTQGSYLQPSSLHPCPVLLAPPQRALFTTPLLPSAPKHFLGRNSCCTQHTRLPKQEP